MNIIVDTREKPRAIKKIIQTFHTYTVTYKKQKLDVGDYMLEGNDKLSIDRKQNLLELVSNVLEPRFERELIRAKKSGIELLFLCEHGNNIYCLEDVKKWENPRLKESKYCISGKRLYVVLRRLELKYGVKFMFCNKNETGKKIIDILGGVLSGETVKGKS